MRRWESVFEHLGLHASAQGAKRFNFLIARFAQIAQQVRFRSMRK